MFIKNIHPNIQGALKAKEKAFARENPEVHFEDGTSYKLNFTDIASRSVFIRMVSNRSPDELEVIQGGDISGATDSEGNFITPFGYNQVYRKKSDGQIRHISGIKDISVEYKGGYKAIRQATVNWMASSLDDLDRFLPHFLNIGQSVLLDWGWVYKNQKINNVYLSDTFFNSETNRIDPAIWNSPMKKIYQSGGNYDAIGGVISNISYKLNEDGGFDCSTTITSVGISLFESRRIDKEPDTFLTKQTSEGAITDEGDGIINAILNLPRILVHNYMNVPARKDDYLSNLDAKLITGRTLIQYLDQRNEKYENRDYLGRLEGGVEKYFDEVITTTNFNDAGQRVGEEGFLGTTFGAVYPRDNYVLVKAGQYFADNKEKKTKPEEEQLVDVIITKLTVADTKSHLYVMDKEVTKFRNDMFVRWGWFEDNILSRYTSYKDSDGEIFNVFRSVESTFDGRGELIENDGEIVLRDVRITNDQNYLLPLDPLKFILPGQVLTSDYLTFNQALNEQGEFGISSEGDRGKANYDFLTAKTFDKLMSINYNNNYSFKVGNGDFGILRNVMINVKEIQKAFGIEGIDDYSVTGEVFGTDKVNPPTSIKDAMKKLCSAFSANYHNYWNFKIVEDPFNKNIKVIEADSISETTKKGYTVYNSEQNTKVDQLGIYKFPSFKKGSFVKNQELEFKIPDSMAVSAMYGMNKNMGNKSPIDTSQNGAELSALSLIQTNGVPVDDKYKNMEIAFLATGADGHSIGNSKKGSGPNSKIEFDGGFNIKPFSSTLWWNRYSSTSSESHKEIDQLSEQETLLETARTFRDSARKITLKTNFFKKLSDIINDDPNNSKAIRHQQILNKGVAMTDTERETMKQLREDLGKSTTRFYTVVPGDDDDFEFNLFPAGLSYLSKNLFELNSGNVEKKKDFLIPADLSIEMDGISGITPGDIFQTDYIPETYTIEKEGMPVTFFQAFTQTQTVSSEGWTTSISGKMRINTVTLKDLIGSSPVPIVHTDPVELINIESTIEKIENAIQDKFEDAAFIVKQTVDETVEAFVAVGKTVVNEAGKLIDDPVGQLQKAVGALDDLKDEALEAAAKEYKELQKKVKEKGLVKGIWDFGSEFFEDD